MVGNGSNDTLYGSIGVIDLIDEAFIGGFVNVSNVDFEYGSNTLVVGNGNGDTLYGTAGVLDLSTLDGGTYGDYGTVGNIINMAGNSITAGQGNNDTVYGSLGELDLLALDASNQGGGTIGTYGSAFNNFSFGHNVITVGNGNNDTVIGTIGHFSLTTTMIPENGGPDVNSFNLIGGQFGGGNTFNLEANSLSAGGGKGDVLYGSVENLSFSASNAHLENLFNADYYHKSYSYIGGALGGGENDFSFGIGNTLTVSNGNNDVLYGTLGDMTMSATNGDPASFISNDPNFPGDNLLVGVFVGGFDGGHNTMTFGDNNLTAGNGNNDVLYGSMHDLVLSATLGGNVGNADLADTSGDSYNLVQFGNNTLTVGNGNNDVLYGNMHDIIVTVDNTSNVDGNIVHFSSSVLNAGSGNDTLVGLMDRIILNGESISQFLSQNTIDSANSHTMFNLGSGADTLVFDASINMGTNIVNNFNVVKDVLEFTNATGPATNTNIVGSLDSASNVHITSDGSHGTLVTFLANGGSIDFTNVNYTGQAHLSDLVNHQAAHLIIV